jgi:hypothetical protein
VSQLRRGRGWQRTRSLRSWIKTLDLIGGEWGASADGRVNDDLPSAAQVPFGGMRLSGIGREDGTYVTDEYLDTKHVSTTLHRANRS